MDFTDFKAPRSNAECGRSPAPKETFARSQLAAIDFPRCHEIAWIDFTDLRAPRSNAERGRSLVLAFARASLTAIIDSSMFAAGRLFMDCMDWLPVFQDLPSSAHLPRLASPICQSLVFQDLLSSTPLPNLA